MGVYPEGPRWYLRLLYRARRALLQLLERTPQAQDDLGHVGYESDRHTGAATGGVLHVFLPGIRPEALF